MSAPDTVSVLAGGYSVTGVDLTRLPGLVIAVNDSAIFAPRVDITLSMDRLWTEFRWPALRDRRGIAYIRRSALKNCPGKWPWLNIFDCDYRSTTFSDVEGILNGTNSGFCAFNLAYRLRPRRIFLFGMDMKRGPNDQPYWHPPYPWRPRGATTNGKYREWSRQFYAAAKLCKQAGIAVTIVGDSTIDCFERVPVCEFGKVAA